MLNRFRNGDIVSLITSHNRLVIYHWSDNSLRRIYVACVLEKGGIHNDSSSKKST